MKVSLATSLVNEDVTKNVMECLTDNRIGQGKFIKEFEAKVAAITGAKHAIAVCNGSMADIVSIASLKSLKPEKFEVIVPSLTFIAQTNAILINGLVPVFVDVTENYEIDVSKIEEAINEDTLAIFVVHLLGRDSEIEKIKEIADKHKVFVVEDCCEAFGGEVKGKKFGTFGEYGTFSFFPSHTITTGEGGMVITNDDKLAELARQVMNHGRRSNEITEKFHFDVFGFNGKMSNVLAAIGSAVASTTQSVLDKRRHNVEEYNKHLGKDWYASSPHCYPVMCKTKEDRDAMLRKLEENGIEARKLFSCLPTQEKVYTWMGHNPGDFPVAEHIGDVCLFVPVHQDLTDELIKEICDLLV